MNLINHAKRELELLGMYEKDPKDELGTELQIKTADSIIAMIKEFCSVGHSGSSAEWTRDILHKLLGWENLTPITSNPDEWEDESERSGYPMWQNKRNPALFSKDGGKTWYNVNKDK